MCILNIFFQYLNNFFFLNHKIFPYANEIHKWLLLSIFFEAKIFESISTGYIDLSIADFKTETY